jgi:hypothetical protein
VEEMLYVYEGINHSALMAEAELCCC